MSNLSIGVYVAVGGVLALLVLGLFLKSLWKVPDPNVTGSFETHAVSPEWFAKFTIELEGAINRLEFDTGGELNLASAPGAKCSCLRLVSGGHLAPGSRYKVMSLESDKPTPVSDLEIRQWNTRNIEIAQTDGDSHNLLEVERGSRYGIRVVTLNGETNATSRWIRTVWKGSLDVEKWFNGHHGALTGDVSHRAGIVRFSVTPTSNGLQWIIKVDILVRGRGPFRPLTAILFRIFGSRLQKSFDSAVKQVESDLSDLARGLALALQEDPSTVAQQLDPSTEAQQLLAAWLSEPSCSAEMARPRTDVSGAEAGKGVPLSIPGHDSPADVSLDDVLLALHTLGGTRLVWDAYPVGEGPQEIGGLRLEDATGKPLRFDWATRSCEDAAYELAHRYSDAPGHYILALPGGSLTSAPSMT